MLQNVRCNYGFIIIICGWRDPNLQSIGMSKLSVIFQIRAFLDHIIAPNTGRHQIFEKGEGGGGGAIGLTHSLYHALYQLQAKTLHSKRIPASQAGGYQITKLGTGLEDEVVHKKIDYSSSCQNIKISPQIKGWRYSWCLLWL